MKKKVLATLFALCIAACLALCASAANVGDVIGEAVYTDITAYINNYPIRSFNINGYTSVVAEELAEYGFKVTWDGTERSLSIVNNPAATAITPTKAVTKAPASRVGIHAMDVLATDIKTYINGKPTTGANIGGYTIVSFEELAAFGKCTYDNDKRALFLTLEGLPAKEFEPVAEVDPLGEIVAPSTDKINSISTTFGAMFSYQSEMCEVKFDVESSSVTNVIHIIYEQTLGFNNSKYEIYSQLGANGELKYYIRDVNAGQAWQSIADASTSIPLDLSIFAELSSIASIGPALLQDATYVGKTDFNGIDEDEYVLEIDLSEIFAQFGITLKEDFANTFTCEISIYTLPGTKTLSSINADLLRLMSNVLHAMEYDVTLDFCNFSLKINSVNGCDNLSLPAELK